MARVIASTLCAFLSIAKASPLRGATAGVDDSRDPSPPVWPGRFHAMMTQVREGDYGVVDLWYDYAAGQNLNVIQTQSGEEDGPLFDNERANGTTYYYHPAKAKAKYCKKIDFGVGILKPDWLKGATFLGEESCGIYESGCYKWEQGEIPEAHARFLGLRSGFGSFREKGIHPTDGAGEGSERPSRPLQQQQEQQQLQLQQQQQQEALRDAAAAGSVTLRGVADEGSVEVEARDEENRKSDRFITYWSDKATGRPVKWVFFTGAFFQVIRFDEGATIPDALLQIPGYCFDE